MKLRSARIVLVLASIWLAIPSTASAQVGVLVGLNMANVSFEAEDESGITISGDRRNGFVAGLSFNLPLQDIFSVEVDALFAQKGTEFTFSEFGQTDIGKIKLNYLDIPVLGRINLPSSGTTRVHLLVGPSFNFKIDEKFEENGEESDNDEDQIETLETALVFGVGVSVNRFRVDLRYGLGLSNILTDNATDGELTGKNRVFSILVGFGG